MRPVLCHTGMNTGWMRCVLHCSIGGMRCPLHGCLVVCYLSAMGVGSPDIYDLKPDRGKHGHMARPIVVVSTLTELDSAVTPRSQSWLSMLRKLRRITAPRHAWRGLSPWVIKLTSDDIPTAPVHRSS